MSQDKNEIIRQLKQKLQNSHKEFQQYKEQSKEMQEYLEEDSRTKEIQMKKLREDMVRKQKDNKQKLVEFQKQIQNKNKLIQQLKQVAQTAKKSNTSHLGQQQQLENLKVKLKTLEQQSQNQKNKIQSLEKQKTQHQALSLKQKKQMQKELHSVQEQLKEKQLTASKMQKKQKSQVQKKQPKHNLQQELKQLKHNYEKALQQNRRLKENRIYQNKLTSQNIKSFKNNLQKNQQENLKEEIKKLERILNVQRQKFDNQIRELKTQLKELNLQKLQLLLYLKDNQLNKGREIQEIENFKANSNEKQKKEKYQFKNYYLCIKTQKHYDCPFISIKKKQFIIKATQFFTEKIRLGLIKQLAQKNINSIPQQTKQIKQTKIQLIYIKIHFKNHNPIHNVSQFMDLKVNFILEETLKKNIMAMLISKLQCLIKQSFKQASMKLYYYEKYSGENEHQIYSKKMQIQKSQNSYEKILQLVGSIKEYLYSKKKDKNLQSKKQKVITPLSKLKDKLPKQKIRCLEISLTYNLIIRSFVFVTSSFNSNKKYQNFKYAFEQGFLNKLSQEGIAYQSLLSPQIPKSLFICINPIISNYQLCKNILSFYQISKKNVSNKTINLQNDKYQKSKYIQQSNKMLNVYKNHPPYQNAYQAAQLMKKEMQIIDKQCNSLKLKLRKIQEGYMFERMKLQELAISIKNMISSHTRNLHYMKKDKIIYLLQRILKSVNTMLLHNKSFYDLQRNIFNLRQKNILQQQDTQKQQNQNQYCQNIKNQQQQQYLYKQNNWKQDNNEESYKNLLEKNVFQHNQQNQDQVI